MIVKQTDTNGNIFYVNIFTRETYKPVRMAGRHEVKIPNYVYGRYKTPQQRGNNKVKDILK